MKGACEGARNHVLRSAYRQPNITRLYNLSHNASHEAIHLLTQLLVFDPVSFRCVTITSSLFIYFSNLESPSLVVVLRPNLAFKTQDLQIIFHDRLALILEIF